MDALSVEPGAIAVAFEHACSRLARAGFAQGLWSRSLDIWPGDDGVRQRIANRLGWLGGLDFIEPRLARLDAFAADVRNDGFTDVVLLGMGGSSLAPEVLRQVLGPTPGFPRFRVLDSVDPDEVRDAFAQAGTTLFVLASKSGSTIEPNAMAAEAQRRIRAEGHLDWGSRFVAITDEGTALHQRAMNARFREIFLNPSDIGGRYSALSFFGMVPAALMGVDLRRLLRHARGMEAACRESTVTANPGLMLGALMAAGVESRRDKLTLLLPDALHSFGLWVEQLVAESTGKSGTGVVPITGEPSDAAHGDDRVVVAVEAEGTAGSAGSARLDALRASAVPLMQLRLPELHAIGAEFLRWEVATAAAGTLLGINPFDEPNVQQAKDATRALLDIYRNERRLPSPEPLAARNGLRLSATRAAQQALDGAPVGGFLRVAHPGDYIGLLAYLPPEDETLAAALRDLRRALGGAAGLPTMFGYGPRYLHSTGQLHKGGANNGVFVLLTADSESDLAIPDEPYTFGILQQAQAIGDFQSLDRLDRRALHVHLPGRHPSAIRSVAEELVAGLSAV